MSMKMSPEDFEEMMAVTNAGRNLKSAVTGIIQLDYDNPTEFDAENERFIIAASQLPVPLISVNGISPDNLVTYPIEIPASLVGKMPTIVAVVNIGDASIEIGFAGESMTTVASNERAIFVVVDAFNILLRIGNVS